jgi:hypothetical protein
MKIKPSRTAETVFNLRPTLNVMEFIIPKNQRNIIK